MKNHAKIFYDNLVKLEKDYRERSGALGLAQK